MASNWRSQLTVRFQLAKFRLTINSIKNLQLLLGVTSRSICGLEIQRFLNGGKRLVIGTSSEFEFNGQLLGFQERRAFLTDLSAGLKEIGSLEPL